MTFCPTCGQQADDGAAFCTGCGMDLRSPTVAAPASDRAGEGVVPVNQRLRSVVNFFSPKCQHCRTKGEVVYVGWQTVDIEHGFGVVTRQETQETKRRDSRGRLSTQRSVTSRQERVPVVRTTIRLHYRCGACGSAWTKDTVTQQEDFSPPPPAPVTREKTVYTREVVKIPCRYCGMLVDPVRDAKCPSCGANLAMVRS